MKIIQSPESHTIPSQKIFFSKERVATFSDAVIAIAITLLVLDIHSDLSGVVSNREVWHRIFELLPNILAFAFSFWLIYRLWVGNQQFFKAINEVDRYSLQLNSIFLFLIALLPLPTRLLASVHLNQATVIIYAVMLALASFVQALMWRHLFRYEHRSTDVSEFYVFYRSFQYMTGGIVFLLSIPLSFWNVYVAVAFWILFGFTGLARESSVESLKSAEERFFRRKESAN